MSIKLILIAIFALFVVFLTALILVMSLVFRNQSNVAASANRRYESYKLADELRQSSDDLTRMARIYVVTGDPVYEKYFYEILAIRNGEQPRPLNYGRIYWDFVVASREKRPLDGRSISLEQLMRDLKFTEEEFSKLREAQQNSDALTELEAIAMNAVKGKFDDGSGSFEIEKAADLELARSLMYGKRYHQAKAGIMKPIDDFFHLVEARTALEVEVLLKKASTYMVIALSLVSGIVYFTIVAFFLLHRRLIKPVYILIEGTDRVARGDYSRRLEVQSQDEIGKLGHAFNSMMEALEHDISEREGTEKALKEAHEETQKNNERLQNTLEELRDTQAQLMEVSTPVAEIWQDTLMLPIMGVIDSHRAQGIMNAMLSKISEMPSKIIILDISGVAVVDTAVANHLIKITKATKLMGCECVISGISPAIAQTIVELGIDVGDIRTTATLRDALEIGFDTTGVELKEIQ